MPSRRITRCERRLGFAVIDTNSVIPNVSVPQRRAARAPSVAYPRPQYSRASRHPTSMAGPNGNSGPLEREPDEADERCDGRHLDGPEAVAELVESGLDAVDERVALGPRQGGREELHHRGDPRSSRRTAPGRLPASAAAAIARYAARGRRPSPNHPPPPRACRRRRVRSRRTADQAVASNWFSGLSRALRVVIAEDPVLDHAALRDEEGLRNAAHAVRRPRSRSTRR